MKKRLLILLCLPFIGFGQTLIPDANFEQALINLGYDTPPINGSVPTANINVVTYLDVSSTVTPDTNGIADLTGIEAFTALTSLRCNYNQLTSIDVSNNINLTRLECRDNQLTSLDFSNNPYMWLIYASGNQLTSVDIRNGNNLALSIDNEFQNNPQLYCIDVDSVAYCNTTITIIDPQTIFSTNCSGTSVEEHTTNKELLKVTDLLGRETKGTNQPLFYIYDDGTVEKRITID